MSVTSGHTEVLVLGAGPGGYAAAFRAADLGKHVTLVDPEKEPGGVCLHRGCIPSKAYLHVAQLLTEAAGADEMGIAFEHPQVDVEKLGAWKNKVVSKMTRGLATLCKARGVDYVKGRGVFVDAHTVDLQTDEADAGRVTFDNAVIATGSRPAIPPALDIDSDLIMNSTKALELDDVPARLLVIGGGYIGLELATVYASLGSRVTVVELLPSLLAGVDSDLVRVLRKRLEPMLEALMLETRVEAIDDAGSKLRVRMHSEGGGKTDGEFERVLVAVGRTPNSSGIGLGSLEIGTDADGFIEVDAQRRTSLPNIFAIGDVAGQPMLAHKATHEGLVAAEAIAGKSAAFEPAAIPAVVFTDPEIAWCGLTEADAAEKGRRVEIARFPWQASGRATTLGRNDGLTKLVIDPEDARVLGVGIAGVNAGELIAGAVSAIEMGATAEDLALTIHPHPTLSETIMEAADVFLGQSVHLYKRR